MTIAREEKETCVNEFLEWLRGPEIAVGARLPGERRLSRRFHASQHLVRLALAYLSREGFVERRGKSGTYLRRRPPLGQMFLTPQEDLPTLPRTRTVSVMLAAPPTDEEFRTIQRCAQENDHLVQIYAAVEHAHRAADERKFLERAIGERYRGVVVHPTPRGRRNDRFFRSIASRIRLAHIGFHSEELPEQSFFLPDWRGAGMMAACRLALAGCREVLLLSAVPLEHHVTQLLQAGVKEVLSLTQLRLKEVLGRASPMVPDTAAVAAAVRSAGPAAGVIAYGSRTPAWVHGLLAAQPDEERPQVIGICDRPAPAAEGGMLLYFDWLTIVRDAMSFIMSSSDAPVHRLYAPEFVDK